MFLLLRGWTFVGDVACQSWWEMPPKRLHAGGYARWKAAAGCEPSEGSCDDDSTTVASMPASRIHVEDLPSVEAGDRSRRAHDGPPGADVGEQDGLAGAGGLEAFFAVTAAEVVVGSEALQRQQPELTLAPA